MRRTTNCLIPACLALHHGQFFLSESTYEGEHCAWGSAVQARKQAWWCVLGGGFGHAYESLNWNMPANWREVLVVDDAVKKFSVPWTGVLR